MQPCAVPVAHKQIGPRSFLQEIGEVFCAHFRRNVSLNRVLACNLARNLAADLAELDISVGAYHPGWVQTDMGGAEADISLAESVAGLTARFAELGPDSTGIVAAYDGTPLPY